MVMLCHVQPESIVGATCVDGKVAMEDLAGAAEGKNRIGCPGYECIAWSCSTAKA